MNLHEIMAKMPKKVINACLGKPLRKRNNLIKQIQNMISYTIKKICNAGGIIVIESVFTLSLAVPGIWTSESL